MDEMDIFIDEKRLHLFEYFYVGVPECSYDTWKVLNTVENAEDYFHVQPFCSLATRDNIS